MKTSLSSALCIHQGFSIAAFLGDPVGSLDPNAVSVQGFGVAIRASGF